jgi:hypothetical protein
MAKDKNPSYYPPPDKRRRLSDVSPTFEKRPTEKTDMLISKKDTDQLTQSLINTTSKQNIELWINHLASYQTRHTLSRFIDEAANWRMDELKSFGYANVNFHNYVENGHQLKNVICRKRGETDNVILVCAHYDSRMKNLNDTEARAPGANDNASGVAVAMEIARILYDVEELNCEIQFAFFSGEEQGLWGSKHYSEYIQDNNVKLHRLINLDMVGSPPSRRPEVTIEIDNHTNPEHNRVHSNDSESIAFGNVMSHITEIYTNLKTNLRSMFDSDYEPFEAKGYVVVGIYDEGQENLTYHSSTDLPSGVDIDYASSVAKMVLATVINEATRH